MWFERVALVAVVGDEDGADPTSAEVFQALNDVGFSIPAQGVTYWVGEAMQGTDYQDLDPAPEKTPETTRTAAPQRGAPRSAAGGRRRAPAP